jgi:hypothetical protein
LHEIIILPVVLHGCEIWLISLREKKRQKGFQNKVFVRGRKQQEPEENGIIMSFMIFALHKNGIKLNKHMRFTAYVLRM